MNFIPTIKKYSNNIKSSVNYISNKYNDFKEIYDNIFFLTDEKGISGLEFHLDKTEELNYSNNITDFTLEDGSILQEAVTPQPITITLSGVVGENLFFRKPKKKKLNNYLQPKINKLSILNSQMSQQAQTYLEKIDNVFNKMDKFQEKVGSIIQTLESLINGSDPSLMKQYYLKLITLAKEQTETLTIKTDFADINNMLIQDFNISSVENTRNKVEISITLKQVAFSKTLFVNREMSSNVKTMLPQGTGTKRDNGTIIPIAKIGNLSDQWNKANASKYIGS